MEDTSSSADGAVFLDVPSVIALIAAIASLGTVFVVWLTQAYESLDSLLIEAGQTPEARMSVALLIMAIADVIGLVCLFSLRRLSPRGKLASRSWREFGTKTLVGAFGTLWLFDPVDSLGAEQPLIDRYVVTKLVIALTAALVALAVDYWLLRRASEAPA